MPKLCCLTFSGGSTSNKNARCPFSRKQSNKNAQMCWLDWRYDMAVLCKLRFWNYGNQWKLLESWKPMNAELWKSIKSGLHLTSLSSGICIFWDQFCRPSSSSNAKAQNVTDPNVQQTKTHEQVTVQFFTELTGKCQFFLRFGRKISTTYHRNVFSRHSLLESK